MKKLIALITVAVMLLSFTVVAICAEPAHPVERALEYKAAYGTPTVDGVMDEIYQASDPMYAEMAVFASSATVKEGDYATAEYRIVWNETTMFIFCQVTDSTRAGTGTANLSATQTDNCDIYVMCDPEFSIETEYKTNTDNRYGHFRFTPGNTVEQEPVRPSSWGGLMVMNQLMYSLNFIGSYNNETDGGYSFEMSYNFNEEFTNTLKANQAERKTTAMGFIVQVNDIMDNDGKRDVLVYSNNASGSAPSTNRANCGKLLLAYQEGAVINTEAETTTEEPVVTTTEEPVVTTTEEPVVTTTEEPVVTTTEKPEETTAKAPVVTTAEAPEKSCGSIAGISALVALFVSAVGIAISTKKY